jgi:predicted esterase
MAKLRLLIGVAAGLCLMVVGAAAFLPAPASPIVPAAVIAKPAIFTELERRDLTPRRVQDSEYEAPKNLGIRHRLFPGVVPRSYDALAAGGEGSPLIVLLHGSGRDGRAMLDMWKVAARSRGLTLIAPNALGNSWKPEDAATVLAAIEDAQDRYSTDPDQVYLFGHSAGAIIAQYFANHVDGPWRAVATHGGYLQADALQPVADGVPIRAYLGSSDTGFNPFDGRKTAQKFADVGHPSEFHLIPEHGHWYYEIGPRISAEATDWFLQF